MAIDIHARYQSKDNNCTLACMRADRAQAACDCGNEEDQMPRKKDPLLGMVAALHFQDPHKHPDLQAQIPVRPRAGGRTPRSGIPELASLRGHQMGVHDAYKALRSKFPKAAKYLLEKFRMSPNGDIRP